MLKKIIINEKIILLAIILLGLIVRLYKINSPILDWHSFRQADTASVSRYFFENGINLLDPRYHDISRVQSGMFNPNGFRLVEFPIYNALHAITYRIFSFLPFDVIGRLLSIIFALVTSYFLYRITLTFSDKKTGFLAMFIYLILPFNIYFTRVILPEPFSVMLGVISLWFFIKYTQKGKLSDLILYSSLMALALLVKPYLIFYNFFVIYYFWKKFGLRRIILNKDAIISCVIILAPIIFWRLWILQHPEGIPFWKWTLNGDGVRFKPAFWYWIFSERLGKLILGVWGVYPFCLGILHNRKNTFLTALLIGGLAYMSVIATANVRHDYYQTLIIPAVSIALALGFTELFVEFKKVRFGYMVPMIILFFMLLISAFQVKEYYKINHPELVDAGKAVDRLTPKNSRIIASYNGDTAFLYQTKRRGWPVVELPIDELIQEGASYYVSVNLNDSQTIEFMKRFQILEKTNTYVVLKLI